MSNVLSHKGYSASVCFDAEDGLFTGHVAGIRDVVGFHADNIDDLKIAFMESVEDYLAFCKELGTSPEKPNSSTRLTPPP